MTTDERFSALLDASSEQFGVTPDDVLGTGKTYDVCLARHVVGALWSEFYPYMDAARRLQKASHYSVLNSRTRVRQFLDSDKHFVKACDEIISKLRAMHWFPADYEPSENF